MAVRLLKTLFVMASFCIGTVLASDYEVYVAKNKMGGKITLTFVDCPISELKGSKISVTRSNDKKVYGCWFLHEKKVYVSWFDPDGTQLVEYDIKLFTRELLL